MTVASANPSLGFCTVGRAGAASNHHHQGPFEASRAPTCCSPGSTQAIMATYLPPSPPFRCRHCSSAQTRLPQTKARGAAETVIYDATCSYIRPGLAKRTALQPARLLRQPCQGRLPRSCTLMFECYRHSQGQGRREPAPGPPAPAGRADPNSKGGAKRQGWAASQQRSCKPQAVEEDSTITDERPLTSPG